MHVHLAPETSSKSFDELTRRVEALEKAAKKPFYTDKSFWIGIITIPLIFAGGWTVKLATDRPFLLREIHRLLGTEPALVAALDENKNSFKDAVVALNKDRLPLLTTLFKVGLLPERAQNLSCTPDPSDPKKAKFRCSVPDGAFISVADAPLQVGAATKADIGIVVNVTENQYNDDGSRKDQADRTELLESKQLIRVAVNGKDLTLSERSRWSPRLDLGDKKIGFARYTFSCFKFGAPDVPDFPMNTLSVSVSNAASRYYSITVGVLVSEHRDECEKT
ncbi:hypothetical protein B7W85_22785 [Allorhizobium ampelinum]|nr:hypothetical protein BBL07_20415 [Agrobacterium vitis]OVE89214.1 hypothetical protein B7W85_22785 [Allorhizobium ampelinum]